MIMVGKGRFCGIILKAYCDQQCKHVIVLFLYHKCTRHPQSNQFPPFSQNVCALLLLFAWSWCWGTAANIIKPLPHQAPKRHSSYSVTLVRLLKEIVWAVEMLGCQRLRGNVEICCASLRVHSEAWISCSLICGGNTSTPSAWRQCRGLMLPWLYPELQ